MTNDEVQNRFDNVPTGPSVSGTSTELYDILTGKFASPEEMAEMFFKHRQWQERQFLYPETCADSYRYPPDTNEKIINDLAKDAHQNSVEHGFWQDTADEHKMAESVALIHSEASELLEAVRKLPHDAPSEHCPEISAQEEELADLVLRVMDYSVGFNFDLGKAILAKMQYNKNRPYKHGGKKF